MANVADIMGPLTQQQPTSNTPSGESPLKAGEVGLLDPSGKPVAAPSHLVNTLLDQGYQQDTPENRTSAALRQKYGGVGGAALAAGAGAARGASLGLSDLALTKSGLASPDALKALEQEHPIASTVGNVAGAFGSAALAPELSPIGMVGRAGKGVAGALGGGVGAKLAGSAVEGAFYGLGQTATEQALGDPNLTAQKVIANVGLGALLGVGGSAVFQGMAGLGRKALGVTGESALGKVNNYLLGTPEADTAYYLANQEAVNSAPEVSTIKDAIDEHVASVQAAYNQSKQAYDNALADVKGMQPDNTLAHDLLSALDEQKKVLGQKGEELEDALARSNLQVPTEVVQNAINKQRNALQIGQNTFGASNSAVKNYLDNLSTQAEALPEVLNGSQLRQIVRSLREDGASAYGLSAGEFAEGKGKAASSIAESLNQYIRAVPEAATILDDMRGRIVANDGLRAYFGSPDKALSSLQAAAGDSAKNELRLKALQEFDRATGSNFVGRIKPYQDARQVIDNLKQGVPASTAIDSVGYSSPELKALGEAATTHEANTNAYNAVKRLSAGRSQSVIESYMSKTAKAEKDGLPPKFSLEDAAVLDHLASLQKTDTRLGGRSIYDAMRARGVLDRFTQSKANGSRNAFILGSLGGGVGGLIAGGPGALAGESAGAMIGGMVDRAGGKAAKKVMDAVLMAKKGGNQGVTEALGQLMLNKLGPAAVAGMKASTIATILDHLQRQNSVDPRQEQRARSLGQLERNSNTTTSRIDSAVQKFYSGGKVEEAPKFDGDTEETMEQIQKLASSPQDLADHIHAQTDALNDMAPDVTQAVNDTAIRAIQYLNSKIPPPSGNFGLDGEPKAKPKAQLATFRSALDTINDPLSALNRASRGTLAEEHVDALRSVYPHLYGELQAHILNALPQEANKLTFSKKTQLSKLVGGPLVREMTQPAIAAAQASTNITVAQDQAASTPKVRSSQKGLAKLDISKRSQTDMQSRLGKA